MEASESTKNSLSERTFSRKRKDEQQTSSRTGAIEEELELELDMQVGRELPPAGLLIFRHRARLPAVDSLVTMFLMKPACTRTHRKPGGRSWLGDLLARGALEGQDLEETAFTWRESSRSSEIRFTEEETELW